MFVPGSEKTRVLLDFLYNHKDDLDSAPFFVQYLNFVKNVDVGEKVDLSPLMEDPFTECVLKAIHSKMPLQISETCRFLLKLSKNPNFSFKELGLLNSEDAVPEMRKAMVSFIRTVLAVSEEEIILPILEFIYFVIPKGTPMNEDLEEYYEKIMAKFTSFTTRECVTISAKIVFLMVCNEPLDALYSGEAFKYFYFSKFVEAKEIVLDFVILFIQRGDLLPISMQNMFDAEKTSKEEGILPYFKRVFHPGRLIKERAHPRIVTKGLQIMELLVRGGVSFSDRKVAEVFDLIDDSHRYCNIEALSFLFVCYSTHTVGAEVFKNSFVRMYLKLFSVMESGDFSKKSRAMLILASVILGETSENILNFPLNILTQTVNDLLSANDIAESCVSVLEVLNRVYASSADPSVFVDAFHSIENNDSISPELDERMSAIEGSFKE